MKKNASSLKFLLDFLPIILFFIAYKFPPLGAKPIIFASMVGGVATVISLFLAKFFKIKLEKISLYSNIAFVIFAGLTVFFDNPDFIKAKLSILNGILGSLLIFFFYTKKPIIKHIFEGKIEMQDSKWNVLNLRFSLMFFLLALLNFYFWKFQSEEMWVNFKTFGAVPFIIIFFVFQIRFIMKNGKIVDVGKND
jgi:intracellular septation protein